MTNNTATAFLMLSGQVYPLLQSKTQIGRSLENDLVINDSTVSRVHAQITVLEDGCLLSDLNSTHGSYVNGTRVEEQVLQSGDIIGLANFTLLYVENPGGLSDATWEETHPLEGL